MKFTTLSLAALFSATTAFTSSPSFVSRSSSTALDARKPFISGNWKLNPQTKEEATDLAKAIADSITKDSPDADVALFVPYVFIDACELAVNHKLEVGAELCYQEESGAFTGGISVPMLKSCGVSWSLAGHSERRTVFGETNEVINAQVLKLLSSGMSAMLCIGESQEEHDQDLAEAICATHLKKGLAGVSKKDMSRVAIAYEPVWAIGTGQVATPKTAQKVHKSCRAILASMYDEEVADNTRILYGGSVTPDSVDDLMAKPDIDGCLVGGASLDAEKFSRIINFEV